MTAGHLGAVTAAAHRRNPSPPSYTGPLDLVPGAVIAYSQRAMAAAYVSNAITIREAAGNTTQSFPTTTNNAVDAAAVTAFLDGANGFATTWFDQSGNSADAAQATTTKQPQWLAAQFGAAPALSFDQTAIQFLVTASLTLFNSGALTAFFVVLPGTPAAGFEPGLIGIDYDRFSGPQNFGLGVAGPADRPANGAVYVDATSDGYATNEIGGAARGSISPAYPDIRLLDVAVEFNTTSIYINNVGPQTITRDFNVAAVGTITGPMGVGSLDINPVAGDTYNGVLAEVIVYDAFLSSADRLAIRQNIAAWYGITLA